VNDYLSNPTFPLLQGQAGVSYQRLFRYSLDPSGKLVHKKDGTVSMTVWSRAASWPSFSRASTQFVVFRILAKFYSWSLVPPGR